MTDQVENAVTDEEMEAQLPKPVGYRLLVALPQIEETIGEMGIIKAKQTMREERILSTVGLVLDMGEQAYSDPTRFPNGPWCKVGDFVMVRNYTGTRFKIYGKEFRVINDDQVEAVVLDPRGITRVAV